MGELIKAKSGTILFGKERKLGSMLILNHMLCRALEAMKIRMGMTIRQDLDQALFIEQQKLVAEIPGGQGMALSVAKRVDTDTNAILRGAPLPEDNRYIVLAVCHAIIKTAAECGLNITDSQAIMVATVLVEEARNFDPKGWGWDGWKERKSVDKMFDALISKSYFKVKAENVQLTAQSS